MCAREREREKEGEDGHGMTPDRTDDHSLATKSINHVNNKYQSRQDKDCQNDQK